MKVRLSNYDWIVLNSSGGKDSQTMLAVVVERCQQENVPLDRVVVAFADLGAMEWPGTRELAEAQAQHYGLRFEVVMRPQGDLLQMVRDRRRSLDAKGKFDAPAWPSATTRYCTAGLKRDVIKTLWTRLCRETRCQPGRGNTRVRILNSLGLRAAGSPARAKRLPFR